MRFWRNNGLSVVLFTLFLVTLAGQTLTGHHHHNEEQRDHGQPELTLGEYVRSPAFLEVTMENWESEFLQMGFYVVLTVFLYQKGSAESKDPDKPEPVDREPNPNRPGAPGPVRRGGWRLALYRNSLSLVLGGLFLISFVLHAVGGAGDHNEEQRLHGNAESLSTLEYMGTSRFWFESFQNWQSEFLAILCIVLFTVWLRQHGSPESKPVDAAHDDTGE